MDQALLTRRGAPGARNEDSTSTSSSPPIDSAGSDVLLVFGGTGFVGSSVLTAALEQHAAKTTATTSKKLELLVITRTGKAPKWYDKDPSLSRAIHDGQLHFLAGDMRQSSSPDTVARAIVPWTSNAANHFLGVVSCIGCITLWNNDNMVVTNGRANIHAYQICYSLPQHSTTANSSKPKFCVISRDRTNWSQALYANLNMRSFPGYYEGKRVMDDFLAEQHDTRGYAVALQAGCVSGVRHTVPELQGSTLPFWIPLNVCCPYECPLWCCFKVINVEDLGNAVVRFILSKQPSPEIWIKNDDIKSFFQTES
ncbi:expressed unknown protein [Seminavis robusta]|uniref:Uncharacterized protein n=1 Tax=Seminavis robusta TaxID=568900 RepID=A0A9N8EQK6_9STRA|nr:expressed unknown protein [Seminavis robusta]|eukprot:Sro1611_g285910.1 n/a (311) ;mRNA; r:8072-9004